MKIYGPLIVLGINIIYVLILLYSPNSHWYHIWEHENQLEYCIKIPGFQDGGRNLGTYVNSPPKDLFRTIGYPAVLNFFNLFKNPFLGLVFFNCFLSAWLFYVIRELIGKKAWYLVFLGMFTVMVIWVLTDILFAALFITSIWQLKRKRLWLHFLLLGIAALVRPSLAWFFVIEPFILYFYGYRKPIIVASFFIAFAVTQFSAVRNYYNHGIWTHSNVMDINISILKNSEFPKYLHIVDTFKINFLEGHPAILLKSVYEKQGAIRWLAYLYALALVVINIGLWINFPLKVLAGKINFGDVLILAYFVGPTIFAPACARIRIPIEWILFL